MMKTPEELRKMGIVVGEVPAPPRWTPEEKEAIQAARRADRLPSREKKTAAARRRALRAARQKRWVTAHREKWNAYVRGWKGRKREEDRRLFPDKEFHPEALSPEELPDGE